MTSLVYSRTCSGSIGPRLVVVKVNMPGRRQESVCRHSPGTVERSWVAVVTSVEADLYVWILCPDDLKTGLVRPVLTASSQGYGRQTGKGRTQYTVTNREIQ